MLCFPSFSHKNGENYYKSLYNDNLAYKSCYTMKTTQIFFTDRFIHAQ